ncbi:MAG TPA: transporter substrate-binding domain-containing protein [Candidatus Limnocylindrales bacterium]|nr:transporter substrate-binding domain-containing protein [Candidatus Limnocylindrales bacterium]
MSVHVRAMALAIVALLMLSACQPGAEPTPGQTPGDTPAAQTPGGSPAQTPGGGGEDLLDRIREQGYIRISTDPNYAPQSFINEEGEYDGFDVAVAREIAERLGVEVRFETPEWDAITAGSWGDRWDVSVGSMTVTEERMEVLDFTQPYYYTPAQLAVLEDHPAQSIDELAGEVVCAGEATTYVFWIEGTLNLGEGGVVDREPPEGMTSTTLPTDAECAQAMRAGRTEFTVWMSSLTTVDEAISQGMPLRKIGEPVFYEPLAAAFDRGGPEHSELLAEIDRIIGEMHEDGTLSRLSEEWFDGVDYTTTQ